MNFNDYQSNAKRTMVQYNNGNSEKQLTEAILGINGEAGELSDLLKKKDFQGHNIGSLSFIDEAGDCLWYLALLSEALGTTLEFIAEYNVTKRKKRYPDGFSSDRSVHRNE